MEIGLGVLAAHRQGYRGPPNHFPYEGLVHPVPGYVRLRCVLMDLCGWDNRFYLLFHCGFPGYLMLKMLTADPSPWIV